MQWVRHLAAFEAGEPTTVVHADVASEARVTGILNIGSEFLLVGPSTTQRDIDGLYKYDMLVRVPNGGSYEPGTRRGYAIQGDCVDEIAALLSLHLQARFYVLSTREGNLSAMGMSRRVERHNTRGQYGVAVDATVFSNEVRVLDAMTGELFRRVRHLPAQEHLSVALAVTHYAAALRELGVDHDMVFVRLVSAVEAIAAHEEVTDSLSGYSLADLIRADALDQEMLDDLELALSARKGRLRFTSVLSRGGQSFLANEAREPAHTQVTPDNIADVVGAIYRARSAYLHEGTPMYHSTMGGLNPAWHTDPSVGIQIDQRTFRAKDKLPKASFFHRLVRHCVLEHINERAS